MIRVRAPSRLHFGLLSFPGMPCGPIGKVKTVSSRSFGGVGLMVQAPGVQVAVQPARNWSAEGPLADRAMAFARRLVETLKAANPAPLIPQHLVIETCAPEHAGLGTGTQLGLAVGRALALAWGLQDLEVEQIARRIGRGQRSALGIHGFSQGGFLVEGGKGNSSEAPAPWWPEYRFRKPGG